MGTIVLTKAADEEELEECVVINGPDLPVKTMMIPSGIDVVLSDMEIESLALEMRRKTAEIMRLRCTVAREKARIDAKELEIRALVEKNAWICGLLSKTFSDVGWNKQGQIKK